MPVENAQFIGGLNSDNPLGTDPRSQGDNHIRLIKAVLKATFPTATGPVTFDFVKDVNIITGGNFNTPQPYNIMDADNGATLNVTGSASGNYNVNLPADPDDGFKVTIRNNRPSAEPITVAGRVFRDTLGVSAIKPNKADTSFLLTQYQYATLQYTGTNTSSGNNWEFIASSERALPTFPAIGSRVGKIIKFNSSNLLEWVDDTVESSLPAQLQAVPTLPDAGDRDNKILKFDGNTLQWEADGAGSGGSSFTPTKSNLYTAVKAILHPSNQAGVSADDTNNELDFAIPQEFPWPSVTAVPAQLSAIPALPAAGSRDNKILKFNGNSLNWEADAVGTGGGTTTIEQTLNIHNDVTVDATIASSDRLVFSDESAAGDPNRYTTFRNLISNITATWLPNIPNNKIIGLSTVATSGDYNDLSNTPSASSGYTTRTSIYAFQRVGPFLGGTLRSSQASFEVGRNFKSISVSGLSSAAYVSLCYGEDATTIDNITAFSLRVNLISTDPAAPTTVKIGQHKPSLGAPSDYLIQFYRTGNNLYMSDREQRPGNKNFDPTFNTMRNLRIFTIT